MVDYHTGNDSGWGELVAAPVNHHVDEQVWSCSIMLWGHISIPKLSMCVRHAFWFAHGTARPAGMCKLHLHTSSSVGYPLLATAGYLLRTDHIAGMRHRARDFLGRDRERRRLRSAVPRSEALRLLQVCGATEPEHSQW